MTNLSKSALLIVDVQNDFCPGGAFAVPNGYKVIKPLNTVIKLFLEKMRPIFFSRDWHPRNTKHFAEFGGKWPVHCVKNTLGAKFHKDLIIPSSVRNDIFFIYKGMDTEDDGYSPFEGEAILTSSSFIASTIQDISKIYKVTELYIGGLATDYCVKASCLDAIKLGYKTYLLLDACRSVNIKPGDEALALNEMANAGVEFITTEEVANEAR